MPNHDYTQRISLCVHDTLIYAETSINICFIGHTHTHTIKTNISCFMFYTLKKRQTFNKKCTHYKKTCVALYNKWGWLMELVKAKLLIFLLPSYDLLKLRIIEKYVSIVSHECPAIQPTHQPTDQCVRVHLCIHYA